MRSGRPAAPDLFRSTASWKHLPSSARSSDEATRKACARRADGRAAQSAAEPAVARSRRQVVALYAGVNGTPRDIPVNNVRASSKSCRANLPRREHDPPGDQGERRPVRRKSRRAAQTRRFKRSSSSSMSRRPTRSSANRGHGQDIKRRIRSIRNTREDHARSGARRGGELGRAQGAHRGLCVPNPTACSSSWRGPRARARRYAGCLSCRHTNRARQSRSFPLTGDAALRVRQLPDPPARVGSSAGSQRRQRVRWSGSGAVGVGSLRFRRLPARRGVHRIHRPAPVPDAQASRTGCRALHGRRGRPGDPGLQRLPVSPVQKVTEQQILPLSEDCSEATSKSVRTTRCERLHLLEPEPRADPRAPSARVPSRTSSTGRCWNRRPRRRRSA